MKFSMAIEKKNRATVGKTEGHNKRLHPTRSQLPRAAWFTPKGHHSVIPWRGDVLNAAKALAKRKDAVVAIELVIAVGNQTDWREMPTPEHPHGKPKPGAIPKIKALVEGVKQAAIREFGEKNIVSIDLHSDESTIHAHVVVTPVKDGKLQAKHWLNGAKKCAQLRARIHEVVSHHIECDYEKGAPGGMPHDPAKRAGGSKGVQPPPSLIKRAMGAFNAIDEAKKLKSQLAEVQKRLETMFSRLKRVERQAGKEREQKKQVELRAVAAERHERTLRRRLFELEHQLEALKPRHQSQDPEPGLNGPQRGGLNL